MPFGSDTQSRSASSTAARSVWSPLVTGTTVAPSSFMRPTFGAWRSMSTEPIYTVQGMPSRAQAAADATPCWPAPVSAMTRFAPSFFASSTCPIGVVDLVRAGVREIFALQPHFRAPALRQRARVRQRRRPADPAAAARREIRRGKSRIAQVAIDAGLQAIERRHERLGHVAPAERPEAAARVGIVALAGCSGERRLRDRSRLRTCVIDLLRAARARRTNS